MQFTPQALLQVDRQIRAARELLRSEPVASARPQAPTRIEETALRQEGKPWSSLAEVAVVLRKLNGSAGELAFELLQPDPEFRWRLFHLGVLGELLWGLGERKCAVRSVRPLSELNTRGPAFTIVDNRGREWDLWFEAGGAWSYYRKVSPYVTLISNQELIEPRPLGSDLLLIRPNAACFVIECKYTESNLSYITRNGYEQALSYAVEAKDLAPVVRTAVVGPDKLVLPAQTETAVGRVYLLPACRIWEAALDFFEDL